MLVLVVGGCVGGGIVGVDGVVDNHVVVIVIVVGVGDGGVVGG